MGVGWLTQENQGWAESVSWTRWAARQVVDLVLPPLCLSCNAPVSDPEALCGPCWADLDFISAPLCCVTGLPFAYDVGMDGGEIVSAVALAEPPTYRAARSALRYGHASGRLVRQFKYSDRTDLTALFVAWMTMAGADLLARSDVILPVPLHRSRLVQRRYNQSAELARGLGRRTGISVATDVLRRVRATASQVGLSGAARRANVAGAFALSPDGRRQIDGQAVLLIDDVLTSGATVNACARTLLAQGAREVNVLTVARVVPGEEIII